MTQDEGQLGHTAVYIRRSTEEQSDEHQRDDIMAWLDYQGLAIGDVEVLAEQASGASSDREQFQRLIDMIEDGELDDVVVWEITRIARNGLMAQEFFEACESNDVTIHVTNGSVRRVDPDGHGRLIADIIAAVAAEERRMLIRRTKSGVRRARDEEGKWVGNVPVGFTVSAEGYLMPNLNPDYDAGECGFFDVVSALEDIDRGKSYNKTAQDTPNVTRYTLSEIHQDKERYAWYMDHEASDDRVDSALMELEA